MPVNKSQLLRLKAIHELIKKGPVTRDQLIHKLNSLYLRSGNEQLSDSTIDKDIKYLKEIGAPVKNHRNRGYAYTAKYFLSIGLSKKDQHAVEAFIALERPEYKNLFSEVNEVFCELYRSINKEDFDYKIVMRETQYAVDGAKWLAPVYNAIRSKEPLVIKYNSGKNRTVSLHHFSPYLLKEYRGIWYVIGYSSEKEFTIVLALDRIKDLNAGNTRFYADPNFSIDEYFKYAIGVYQHVTDLPKIVKIWVSEDVSEYFKIRPLHHTQKVKGIRNRGVILELKVFESYELIATLLGWGEKLKVLSPKSLVQKMRDKAEAIRALY